MENHAVFDVTQCQHVNCYWHFKGA